MRLIGMSDLTSTWRRQGKRELDWTPKAVVLIGSYQGPPQYALEPGVLSGIPSLHLFGSNDHVIPARKSQHVADLFQDAAVRFFLLVAPIASIAIAQH